MTEINVDAIIIGSTEINEKDKMVRAVTKDGYLSFFAKGVSSLKSKNAPSLTTFSKSNLTLFASKNGTYSLKTGLLRKTYFSFSSYEEMAVCSLMEEIAKLFLNETVESSYFEVIEGTLEAISNGEDPLLQGLSFLCTMNKNEGVFPSLNKLFLNQTQKDLLEALISKKPLLQYQKSDLVEIYKQLFKYIEDTFNVVLRTKDLICIV